MFIVAQFPVADLRSLAPQAMGRLDVPDWSADDPGETFVRGFGAVSPRNSGGAPGLLGERAFADFNRAARYRAPIEFRQPDWPKPLAITPWFRRLYFDGVLAGRFEFGFLVPDLAESDAIRPGARDGLDVIGAARAIAAAPLLVRGVDLPAEELPLQSAGGALGRAYLAATTERRALMEFPISETYGRYVAVGPPTILVRVSNCRPVIIGRGSRRIAAEKGGEIFVASCRTGAGRFGVVAQTSVFGALDEMPAERAVRVLFSHLNAVIYAASHAKASDLADRGEIGRDTLADLLARTLGRLETLRKPDKDSGMDEEFIDAVRAFGRAYAGRLDELFVRIEAYGEELRRPPTAKGLMDYARDLLDTIVKKVIEVGIERALGPGG